MNPSLLSTALRLFEERGYENVTMMLIAEEAKLPVEAVFAEYSAKSDFVLALYHRLSIQLEERLGELPTGSVGTRFTSLMRWKIKLLAPYRRLFKRLNREVSKSIEKIGVLSPYTEHIRVRVSSIVASCVFGSSSSPLSSNEEALIRCMYRVHLLLVWIWIHVPLFFGGCLLISNRAINFISFRSSIKEHESILERIDCWTSFIDAPLALNWNSVAEKILGRVFLRRRLQQYELSCALNPCRLCFAPHLLKLQRFVDKGEPIHFVLPAFPAKSPNLSKVLGDLPDLGEELALRSLQSLCNEIQTIYPPGARITICSDGHVFSDLVQVDDARVSRYSEHLMDLMQRRQFTSFDLFDLKAAYKTTDYDVLRRRLEIDFGDPLELVKERIKTYPHHRSLFDGIHRFVFEDRVSLYPELSRSQNRTLAKETAYQVIMRSNAWSRLVAECFPHAVRLSIHPQEPHSEKIGIKLCDAADNWITPWHGALLLEDDIFILVKRKDAEERGAVAVQVDGRLSHLRI